MARPLSLRPQRLSALAPVYYARPVSGADRIVGDRYEILEDLGAGGHGSVHRARDLKTHELIALKLLTLPHDARTEARFRREAKAQREIAHPNCVRVFDTGEDREARLLYIAMELVEGETLDALLQRSNDRLPQPRAIEIVLEILSALEAAHAAGVVHRDLKPANILIGDSFVKVCDFGSAKILRRNVTQLTRPGSAVGTGQYMAPEQARGAECDERADLYAAGALLYEMITGKAATRPSDRTDDRRLDPIFARSLADDREARFKSAAEMSAALKRASSAPKIEVAKRTSRAASRVLAVFAGGAGIGALVFVLGSKDAGSDAIPREVCAVALSGEAELVADRPLDVYAAGEWLGRTPIAPRSFSAGALDLEVVDPTSSKRRKIRVYVEANARRVFELTRL